MAASELQGATHSKTGSAKGSEAPGRQGSWGFLVTVYTEARELSDTPKTCFEARVKLRKQSDLTAEGLGGHLGLVSHGGISWKPSEVHTDSSRQSEE